MFDQLTEDAEGRRWRLGTPNVVTDESWRHLAETGIGAGERVVVQYNVSVFCVLEAGQTPPDPERTVERVMHALVQGGAQGRPLLRSASGD